MSQLYLIAIGGTGMRCLEAFVHLCAIGMFDNKEINILGIDTDFNNGNVERTKSLIQHYTMIKQSGQAKMQKVYKDSFFSAKLNFYYFTPEYKNDRKNFRTLSRINRLGEEVARQNETLANLLFDPATQAFDLSHGYRAQTHIGSHLMYHAILEEMREYNAGKPEGPESIAKFLSKLGNAGEAPKVFIMGSIFGGTGASSIPIIPKALRDGRKQVDPSAEMPLNIMYGATLLTSYFRFAKPMAEQLSSEKLIADSDRFGLNCQAALKFYNEDLTVRRNYKRMYHVGWPSQAFDYDDQDLVKRQGRQTNKVMTGGAEQRNPAHIVEFICAFAAYHFFHDSSIMPNERLKHMYKTVPVDPKTRRPVFGLEDLIGLNSADLAKLRKKFSAMVVFAMMIQNHFGGKVQDFVKGLKAAGQHHSGPYEDIPQEDYLAINAYLDAFAYELRGDSVISNWLHQIKSSTVQSGFLGLSEEVYSEDHRVLSRANWGKVWQEKRHHFPGGLLSFTKSPFDKFLNAFRTEASVQPDKEISDPLEKLLNHIYKTTNHLHSIN